MTTTWPEKSTQVLLTVNSKWKKTTPPPTTTTTWTTPTTTTWPHPTTTTWHDHPKTTTWEYRDKELEGDEAGVGNEPVDESAEKKLGKARLSHIPVAAHRTKTSLFCRGR